MNDVVVTRAEGVLTLRLVRTQKKNALTAAMYEAMMDAFRDAEGDADIGVIVIRGGDGVFTAGNDIADFIAAAQAPGDMAAWRFVEALARLETPLVAAIEGVAVGVGATLMLHCDLVYAAPQTRFHMPFVDLGLVPEAGSSLLLPQRIGMARASEMFLLGELFDAAQAHRLGLVNEVVPAETLYTHAQARAATLAAKPRAAVAATRRLLRGDRAELHAQMKREAEAFAQALKSGEAQKAFLAFMARSKGL
ncbi:MAG: Enoyl-CoA hydratase/isomerase [Hyphomicrobiales bacterium]|nr:Enoyl-CoA hydratase/isomerase [Hyphomicrobiales bacterium]